MLAADVQDAVFLVYVTIQCWKYDFCGNTTFMCEFVFMSALSLDINQSV